MYSMPGTSSSTEKLERMEQWNCTKDNFTNFSLSVVSFKKNNELPTLKLQHYVQ